MPTNTVRFHRVLRATPERVYRAFLDADAMAKWLPPNGFTGKVHHMDAKVGGSYKMSFTNFSTGRSHSFGGKYLELVPHERIRHSDRFDDPSLPGEMQTTITLKKVSCGTELNVVQEGLPEVIPPEACCLGWQESLTLLAQLVEAEIFLDRRNGLGIEDDEVGHHTRLHESAVIDAEGRRRVEGEPADGVLERHDLLLPHPEAEETGGVADVRVELHVGAAVGEPNHRVGGP